MNISHNNRGAMGYETPNIDRIAREGLEFSYYYGQQSCTAGRAAFITGQNPVRTGLTKVGMPGADIDVTERTKAFIREAQSPTRRSSCGGTRRRCISGRGSSPAFNLDRVLDQMQDASGGGLR